MKIPPLFIALDAIGCVLAGIGLAEIFVDSNLVPESMRFENYEIAMIVVGVILVIPMLYSIVANAGNPPGEM